MDEGMDTDDTDKRLHREVERIAALGLPALQETVAVQTVGGVYPYVGVLVDVSFSYSSSFPVTLVLDDVVTGRPLALNWENVVSVRVNA